MVIPPPPLPVIEFHESQSLIELNVNGSHVNGGLTTFVASYEYNHTWGGRIVNQ